MGERLEAVWVNGVPDAMVSPVDRGLAYGDGLFETMACTGAGVRYLDWHLERLAHGCRALGIAFDEWSALAHEIGAAARPEAMLKLVLTRGPATARGYRPSGTERATRILTRHPWPREGLRAFSCASSAVCVAEQPRLAGLKHLNRLEQVLARQAPEAQDVHEVLMFDGAGRLVGGSMSNVFVRTNTLSTPALDRAGVAGIQRRAVLSAAAAARLPIEVRDITRAELQGASEVFVTNARWGVQPVARLDGRALAGDDAAMQLRRLLDAR